MAYVWHMYGMYGINEAITLSDLKIQSIYSTFQNTCKWNVGDHFLRKSVMEDCFCQVFFMSVLSIQSRKFVIGGFEAGFKKTPQLINVMPSFGQRTSWI